MRSLCLIVLAALGAGIVSAASAHQPRPAIPPEIGSAQFVGPIWSVYRCSGGPVYNFYHDTYYGEEPPALYRGYAYRPYHRYSAYRGLPRTYFCVID